MTCWGHYGLVDVCVCVCFPRFSSVLSTTGHGVGSGLVGKNKASAPIASEPPGVELGLWACSLVKAFGGFG